jgi:cobyrinic acid a,c-diamide synthase
VHFGYADVHFEEDSVAAIDTWLRGHSFHCSRIVREEKVDKKTIVHYSLSGEKQQEGFAVGNVFGSYIHLHFAADSSFASRFVSLARTARREHAVRG